MEKRNNGVDILKAIAAICVVAIHVRLFSGMGGVYEVLYSCIETISRAAVPVFLFFNGFYFYKGYQKYGNMYYKKFCIKILKIHFIAGMIYKGIEAIESLIKNKTVDINLFFGKRVIKEFFYSGFYFHLWYLPVVIIIITILYIFIKINKIKMLLLISLILYMITVVCSVLKDIIDINLIKYGENRIFLGMIFVTMGYIYSCNKKEIKKYFIFNTPVLFILLLLERLIVYLLTGDKEGVSTYFTLVPITYYIVEIFMNKQFSNKYNLLTKFGKGSIGIYLYHCMGMTVCWQIFKYFKLTNNNIIYHILILFLSYIISYYFYQSLEKFIMKIKDIIIKTAKNGDVKSKKIMQKNYSLGEK